MGSDKEISLNFPKRSLYQTYTYELVGWGHFYSQYPSLNKIGSVLLGDVTGSRPCGLRQE